MENRYEILVLEDNEELSEVYRSLLGDQYDVSVIDSINGFFEYIQSNKFHRPDLIIADNQFDDGSLFSRINEEFGIDFRLFHEVTTFAVSGYNDEKDIGAAYALGIKEYIDKPIKEDSLHSKIKYYMKRVTPYVVDTVTCAVTHEKKISRLTRKEMELFVAINDREDHFATKDDLCRRVFGLEDENNKRKAISSRNNLSVHLASLRKKLEPMGIFVENTPTNNAPTGLQIKVKNRKKR